jgi:squalene synthase HpnC
MAPGTPTASSAAAAPPRVDHYENFPVASWLCPPELRRPIASIYHFARTADDLADEGEHSPEQRLQQLTHYRQALASLYTRDADFRIPFEWQQVFRHMAQAIATHRLPHTLLDDLLRAFMQDVQHTRDGRLYADREQLLAYCRWSANPVGRLLLHLYGVTDERALAQSDAICSALQLINFWQDLSQDIPRGRHYIPQTDRQRFGLSTPDVQARVPTPAMGAFVQDACEWTRTLMHSGADLVHTLPGRAGWELRAVVQGGLLVLDHVQALGAQAIHTRKKLGKRDGLRVLWRAVRM